MSRESRFIMRQTAKHEMHVVRSFMAAPKQLLKRHQGSHIARDDEATLNYRQYIVY
jgi:hypothetical protein